MFPIFISDGFPPTKLLKMMLLVVIVIVALFVFYKYLAKNHDFFKNAGVKSKPFLLLGNTGSILLKRISMGSGILWLYNAFPNEK